MAIANGLKSLLLAAAATGASAHAGTTRPFRLAASAESSANLLLSLATGLGRILMNVNHGTTC